MNSIIFTTLFFAALMLAPSAFAKKDCRDDVFLNIIKEDGTPAVGKICWKDRYFISAYKLPRDTVQRIVGPYIRVGEIQNGVFKGKKSYSLSPGFPEWCQLFDYLYAVDTVVSEKLLDFDYMRPAKFSSEVALTELPIQVIDDNRIEYVAALYCSDTYYSLDALGKELAEQEGRVQNMWNGIRFPPLPIQRQK